ncbi:sn-glycerol-1-phosphate dehydrogenase [Alkalibacter mobilis]|uniref:sn-glycerol-1-phosphate dehydrogenase n=1 Tax=Alkalibacter mobilis TaxID=2787712 RepID=UPI0018A02867|nr:sn-glycerol-1-phosphate dehydrogenase [Alkalibacter mobilis]MBF7097107.1 sn-glycerol-1-phosphate dehydrogenase [Alkalibacter mobilis]
MKDYKKLLDNDVKCDCGRVHFVPIKDVDFTFKASNVTDIVKKYISGSELLVVIDYHTDEQINNEILKELEGKGFNLTVVRFTDKKLVPDERAVGAILMHSVRGTDGILAVGSGTINDLARFVGSRMEIPVISIATAPSMDGYAAAGSSLVVKGAKKTLKAVPVTAIYGDVDVIANAPFEMIQAGYGDIIGKKTSLADWALSRVVTGEYWCDDIVKLVEDSTDICIENSKKIAERDIESIKHLIEALVLSGIAMSMADDTRPASGSEHLISHYMVMKNIEKGEMIPSHGITVAFGTLVVSMLYEFLKENEIFKTQDDSRSVIEAVDKYVPTVEQTKEWLEIIGLPVSPEGYGVDEAYLEEMILKAGFIRDRFTIFRYLDKLGILNDAAKYVLAKMF